jgi:hypothetical protein
MTARSLCLSLELDFEGERVTGWLADEQGNDWAFSSWLDLLTLIDRITTAEAPERRRLKGDGRFRSRGLARGRR